MRKNLDVCVLLKEVAAFQMCPLMEVFLYTYMHAYIHMTEIVFCGYVHISIS